MSYIKKRRILCRLQKYKLNLVTKCTKKVIGEERYLKNYFLGLVLEKAFKRKPKNVIKPS
jgi:hypothetical protein